MQLLKVNSNKSSIIGRGGGGAKAKDIISPSTSLPLLDWVEEEGREMVDGETDWLRFWSKELDWMLLNLT